MKKVQFNKNGMKMLIDTGWKEFDRQTNYIGTGNVVSNTQVSMYIRPWKETECNGRKNPEGHLLDFDLKPFRTYHIPECIKQFLTDKEREKGVILYMFFVRDRGRRIEPFCWVVTDSDYKLIKYSVVYGYKQNYWKRHNAADTILEYITA